VPSGDQAAESSGPVGRLPLMHPAVARLKPAAPATFRMTNSWLDRAMSDQDVPEDRRIELVPAIAGSPRQHRGSGSQSARS